MLKRPGMPGMGGGYPPKRPRAQTFSDKTGIRVLLPSKMAGCLIGKGGSTINKLRTDFDSSVRIPDCAGPERILEIVGKDWDSVFGCLEAAIPWLYECPDGLDNGTKRELRFLIHQAIAGAVIGKGGERIKQIRDDTGVMMKVFSAAAPQSTDRCVQVDGKLDQVMLAAREIYTIVQGYDLTAHEAIYDPVNYDAFYAHEYGGFGKPGKNPPPPMPPAHRGGPYGPGGGGFGPRAGYGAADDAFGEPGGPYGGPPGRFGGGPEFGWGGPGGPGPYGRPNGGNFKSGVKLEFKQEDDNTFSTIIEKDLAGAIIGIGGSRIRKIRSDSGATVQIGQPEGETRNITVIGDEEATRRARQMLQAAVYEFGSAGPNNGGV